MASAFVSANSFNLSGAFVHVTYTTTGIDGKPHFCYQDVVQNLNFKGNEIRVQEGDLGNTVSVWVRRTIDSGSTSFSVLIPKVNLNKGEIGLINTVGITTIHRFSLLPALNHGQQDLYTVTPLVGTASHLQF